jgi:hypothetical protein
MAFALVLAGLVCDRTAGAAGCPTPGFAPARSFLSGGAHPFSIAVGDFNGDGKPDLAVANAGTEPDSSVSILLGNGDGTFQPHVDYYAGSDPDSVAVADFNGDGKLDVVVASPPDGTIWVLLGNGDGTFQPAVSYPAQGHPGRLAVGDFNSDGKPDVVVSGGGNGGFSVLLGKGDGTFQAPLTYGDGFTYFFLTVAVGDFNGDGRADVVGPGPCTTNCIIVLLGNGDGTFQAPVEYDIGVAADWIAVGDVNGDGRTDLAVAGGTNAVYVLTGRGDGTFQSAVKYSTGLKGSQIAGSTGVVIGDFNGDGNADLAVANVVDSVISVLLGNGDGSFQPAVRFGVPTGAFSLTIADFNGDGSPDLAAVADGPYGSSTNGYVGVLLNTCLPALPTLSTADSNSSVTVGWPALSAAFVLESTTNLVSPNWQPASELARTNNGQMEVTVTIAPGERYFRLRKL